MSDIVKIRVPETLTIKLPTVDAHGNPHTREVSFFRFLEDSIFSDGAKMGRSATDIRRCTKVLDAFEAAKPGDVVNVPIEVWLKMNMVAEEPSGGWNPFYARQFMTFIDAVQNAGEENGLIPLEPGI